MKIFIYPVIVLLILTLLLTGCGSKAMNEAEAIKIAEEIIARDYPDMVDAARSNKTYSRHDREFHQITFSSTYQAASDSGTVAIPRTIIISIDADTGEQFIAVSD